MGSPSSVKEALKNYYAQRPCSALQLQSRRQPVADVTDLGGADLMGHGVGVPGSGMASGLQQVMGLAAHLRLQDVVMQAVGEEGLEGRPLLLGQYLFEGRAIGRQCHDAAQGQA